MNITYNDKTDLLYIRFDDKTQEVLNKRISEDLVLDMGENDQIVGIEIMDASRHLSLQKTWGQACNIAISGNCFEQPFHHRCKLHILFHPYL